jgi:hypothetical protein
VDERAIGIARLERGPVDAQGYGIGEAGQRRVALAEESRIWLPAALSCSLGSPCAAYASLNSYASSMALQREANKQRFVKLPNKSSS